MREGLLVKSISGEYTVFSDGERFVCKARGLFRHQDITPMVGDKVSFDENDKYILKIHPRKNKLVRPFVANIDKVFVLTSVKEPDLNLNLLDRILSIIEYNNIEAIIVFSKLDLLKNKEEYEKVKTYYQKIGYKVYETSFEEINVHDIIEEFDNSICAVAGQTGVGKTTMINGLDSSLNLKTDIISMALGRGKHTTRHVELLRIGNGYIADAPGFGTVDFDDLTLQDYSMTFKEFFEISKTCKFPLCTHINEPGCKVKDKVETGEILKSRYENYLIFASEVKENRKKKY